MLLIWHGTWRRHIYEDPTVTEIEEVPEDTDFLLVTIPPLYELESVVISYPNDEN